MSHTGEWLRVGCGVGNIVKRPQPSNDAGLSVTPMRGFRCGVRVLVAFVAASG